MRGKAGQGDESHTACNDLLGFNEWFEVGQVGSISY